VVHIESISQNYKANLQMLEQAVSQTCAIAAAVATLSMQSLDAFDPDPVKGTFEACRRLCSVPSSPMPPCTDCFTKKAKENCITDWQP
jgi:hypothetical protein